jgi:hypothetical protein
MVSEGTETVAKAKRSQGLDVAGFPVTSNSNLTIRDTAWLVLDQLKQSTTTFKATTDWAAHDGTRWNAVHAKWAPRA